jgi:predicted amidohydrolase
MARGSLTGSGGMCNATPPVLTEVACSRSVGRVTVLRSVRVAAIQATPVILDAEASVAKAIELLAEAAAQGAELAVLPETFVPLYPSNRWAHDAARFSGWDQLWERLWANAVDVPGPFASALVAACERHGIHAVVGVNERGLSGRDRSTTRCS